MDTPVRILLVEDDPTSARFIAAALEPLPALVDHADSMASALELARRDHHDVWLIDARLPDGDGVALLGRLRGLGLSTRALAHTASTAPDDHEALLAAGFRQVLRKPLAAIDLRQAVERMLGLGEPRPASPDAVPAQAPGTPLWDDAAALRALNGNAEHVAQLRMLFMAELQDTGTRLMACWRDDDQDALEAGLHRLRAGCGFVGAARLADAVATWEADPGRVDLRSRFERVLWETLDQPPS